MLFLLVILFLCFRRLQFFLVLTRSLVWSMLLWLDEFIQSSLDVSARWFKLLRRD